MKSYVLDSFALLAFLRDEKGAETVNDLLLLASESEALVGMTEVNYAEVKYISLRKDGEEAWNKARTELSFLPIQFHSAQRALAERAANFKAAYRMSLADAFAAALAEELSAELVTDDPEFKPLAKRIQIRWLNGE